MKSGLNEFFLRVWSFFRKGRMEREMAEELEFHESLLREKLLREGVPESRVDLSVRRRFGSKSRWQEHLRELWQFRTVENLGRDITFALRLLRSSPGFTAVALLTLGLSVGANTAIFSLVDGLLLRPLPVPHSNRLVVIGLSQGSSEANYGLPAPPFRGLESRHDLFSGLFAFSDQSVIVHGSSGNEAVPGLLVSGAYFSALETPPLLGRYLTATDDHAGGSPAGLAVVLSESYWQNRFHRDPGVLGNKLQIANTPFTIVGVMPKQFIGADPTLRPQIYLPLTSEPIVDAPHDMIAAGYHGWWLTVMGRLEDGVTLEQANAVLGSISLPIFKSTGADPDWVADAEKTHVHLLAVPGARGFTYLRSLFREPLIAIFSMCVGILMLASMNLASLIMARAAARERELATRLALGATRRRLLQQLLVESLLIAVLGSAAGVAVAPLVSRLLANMLMRGSASHLFLDTSLDLRVLSFAAFTACATALMIGLLPALQATSGSLNKHIKEGQYAIQSQERKRVFPRVLLGSEVALALLLVVGAGLLATSMVRLYKSEIGFEPKGIVNVTLNMNKQPLDGEVLTGLYRQIGEQLNTLPGVHGVSFERIVPLSCASWTDTLSAPGGQGHELHINEIGPDYFRTMRIPIDGGRDFRWTDSKAAGAKIILNQAAARLLFGSSSNAIGQTVVPGEGSQRYEVLAVVGDAKYDYLRRAAPPTAYWPITQTDQHKPSYSAVMRVDHFTIPFASAVRGITGKLAPEIPSPELTSMERVLDESISSERVMAMLSVFFAVCALLVTAIGLYGTLSYNTARRTSEIGIRMALGAQRSTVVALVFRENLIVAISGCVAGLVSAVLASRALASFLYETSPRDPWILLGSVTALALIASGASLLPAIRAASIEPISAIRCE